MNILPPPPPPPLTAHFLSPSFYGYNDHDYEHDHGQGNTDDGRRDSEQSTDYDSAWNITMPTTTTAAAPTPIEKRNMSCCKSSWENTLLSTSAITTLTAATATTTTTTDGLSRTTRDVEFVATSGFGNGGRESNSKSIINSTALPFRCDGGDPGRGTSDPLSSSLPRLTLLPPMPKIPSLSPKMIPPPPPNNHVHISTPSLPQSPYHQNGCGDGDKDDHGHGLGLYHDIPSVVFVPTTATTSCTTLDNADNSDIIVPFDYHHQLQQQQQEEDVVSLLADNPDEDDQDILPQSTCDVLANTGIFDDNDDGGGDDDGGGNDGN